MVFAENSQNKIVNVNSATRLLLIGHILLEAGLVNPDQLQRALDEQAKGTQQGKHILLGQIFVVWGLITQVELDESIEKLSRCITEVELDESLEKFSRRNELIRFGTAHHKSVISKRKRLLDIVGALVGLG